MQELSKVVRNKHFDIATKWYELSLDHELLDDSGALKVIEVDHYSSAKDCCCVMFQRWITTSPNASWSQLVSVLNNVETGAAADVIIFNNKRINLIEPIGY